MAHIKDIDTQKYINNPLATVIKIFGSQSELARRCGVCQQLVNLWLRTKTSPKYCIKIEQLVNKKVTRYDLRPDIFGKKEDIDDFK